MATTSRGTRLRERWSRARIGPLWYSYIARHPSFARSLARLWGTDVDRLHAEYAKISEVPEGTAVLDVPCGAGVTLRHLPPGRKVSYAAVDLAPVMIEKARAVAAEHGLDQIEFYEAGVDAMPFEENSFDLVLTYNGLQHFPDPPGALLAIGKVLRPGGELRGSAVVKSGLKSRAIVAFSQRRNKMGYVGDTRDLRRWLTNAGIKHISMERNGLLYFFSGRKAAAAGHRAA
jgi:SAM-dependent methyltransferase